MSMILAAGIAGMVPAGPAAADPPADTPPGAIADPVPPSVEQATDEALDQARQSGQPVLVDAATTSTDMLTANPDGTLSLETRMLPSRKKVDGQWRDLDATLQHNADGTISSVLAMGDVRLSGGGAGPMATMRSEGAGLAFTAPVPLPEPTLTGDTATYAEVLPGVDLVLTARSLGGFSHVLVVKNAAAAANPAVQQFTVGTTADGVTVQADEAGNLSAVDRIGRPVFNAPAPQAWDSTAAPARAAQARGMSPREVASSGKAAALVSSAAGPGVDAVRRPVEVSVEDDAITLTPPADLLTGPDTIYPVYVDPSWVLSSTGAKKSGYASVAANLPTSNKWNNSADPDHNTVQVGNADGWKARTMVNFPIALNVLKGATIDSATLDALNTYAYQCNDNSKKMNIYVPATRLSSSNATWNQWENVNTGSDLVSVAAGLGYSSNCPADTIGFEVKTLVSKAVSSNRSTQTFLLKSANESDSQSYREFAANTFKLTVKYNRKPNKPTVLSTSPTTSCTANPPSFVGDADVTLYAQVSDPDRTNVGVRFNVWKTSNPGTLIRQTDPNTFTYGNGTTAVLTVPVATLRTESGSTPTQFSWRVQTFDGFQTSDWSATCNFMFDATRPSAPTFPELTAQPTIGQPYTFSILNPVSGTAPTRYAYQLNAGAPGNYLYSYLLTTVPTPSGGTDWNTWRTATAKVPTGTAMFLWQPSTGRLDLWTGLHLDADTQVFSYTDYQVATGWNTGSPAAIVAGDADSDGDPDLWTVGAGKSRSYLTTINGTNASITAQPEQTLSTANHNWLLNDATDGAATTAADIATPALPLTGTGGVTWNTGDLYDPDAVFDGTNGVLTASANAVTTDADFTVSAWVKSDPAGGTILSQDATTTTGFRLYVDPSTKSWNFSMTRTDVASPAWDTVHSIDNSVDFGAWNNITATYDASSQTMKLYVNDVNVSYFTRTTDYKATGPFRIGAHRTNSTVTGFFNGQISDVRTWNTVADPARAQTPPGYYKPITAKRIMDTRNGLGGVPSAPIGQGQSVALGVVGGTTTVPSANVTAVALTVTAIAPTSKSHLTVWPDLTVQPTTSNVNYDNVGGGSIANTVIVPVGTNGRVRIFNYGAPGVNVLVEVVGYFTTDPTAAGTYYPIAPTRFLDTRPTGKKNGGTTTQVQIAGANSIPTGITAVALNLTTLDLPAGGSSYLVAYGGTTMPSGVSTAFAVAGRTTSTLVIVPVGADGKISIYVQSSSMNLILDVFGYFSPGANGLKYHPVGSTRLVDTRPSGVPLAGGGTARVSQGTTIAADDPVLVTNVVATGMSAAGYLTVYGPDPRPIVSTLNYPTNTNISNSVLAQTADGTTSIYTNGASTHLIVDLTGYFSTN